MFWAGRQSVDGNSALQASPPHELSLPEANGPLAAIAPVLTSTAGLCPCPKPRPARTPRKKRRPLTRRRVPAKTVKTATRADPTARTAAFLRKEAARLSACAPASGAPVRLHLEVVVAPSGEIRDGRITNLQPAPADVGRCVLDAVRALRPPGFDAVEARRFGLTVVL